ncbi:MAG TPA: hypothetical protein VKX17_17245 [Planctomycetota bacterium]|nr:hypothetical protein [Planctomycetota bacterium]
MSLQQIVAWVLCAATLGGCGAPPVSKQAAAPNPAPATPNDARLEDRSFASNPATTPATTAGSGKNAGYAFNVLTANGKSAPGQFDGVGRDGFIVSNAGTIYRKDRDAPNIRPAADAIENETRVINDAKKELTRTVVTPYLQYEHRDGESLMWCTTAQLAWNEFCDALKEPLRMAGDPPSARFLNERLTSKADLDEASYVARGGESTVIIPLIREEWKRKFPNGPEPRGLDGQGGINDDGSPNYFLYGALIKKLKFDHWFTAFHTHLAFLSTDVQGFGCSTDTPEKEWKDIASQVKAWYRSDSEFAVELITEAAQDRLIFARVKPDARLADTVKNVMQWTAQPAEAPLLREERLEIPMMNFDLCRTYDELQKGLLNKVRGANPIAESKQWIRLELNERGAVLESFNPDSTWVIADGEESPKPKLRRFVFDGPFLMLLMLSAASGRNQIERHSQSR